MRNLQTSVCLRAFHLATGSRFFASPLAVVTFSGWLAACGAATPPSTRLTEASAERNVVGTGTAQEGEAKALDGAVASNGIGLVLLRTLINGPSADRTARNVLVAPACLSSALAMLSAGAGGTTAEQLLTALGFAGDQEGAARAYGRLTQVLGSDSMTTASRVWTGKGTELKAPFADELRDEFGADAGQADFSGQPAQALAAINDWTAAQTHGQIRQTIAAIDPATRLLLTDATYLNGTWQQPFASKATTSADFATATGAKPATFMHLTASFPAVATSAFTVVELAYEHGHLAMDVVVPAGASQPWLAPEFAPELTQALAGLTRQTVQLALPAFAVRSDLSLRQPLAAMGITEAFGGRANFSRLSDARNLVLGGIAHQTVLQVTERGTEAGASTAAGVVGTVRSPDIKVVAADHPFLYLIRDTGTGAYIFIGVLADPETAKAASVAETATAAY